MTPQNKSAVAVADKPEKIMEFIPFGAADKIKLTIRIIQDIVAVPTKTGRTCSERDAMRFMMMCQAQRLNPFAGDAFLVGYDTQNGPSFSLITAHQAFLKRAETSADFDGMTSGILLKKGDGIEEREGDFHLQEETQSVVGGWAKVFHKKRSHPTNRRIRMDRFNNGFAQWKVDAAGMIVKCAEADALRSTFPTLLGGLYMKEELEATVEEVITATVSSEAAQATVTQIEAAGKTTEVSPNVQLEEFVLGEGFTFTDFQKLAVQQSYFKNADAVANFDEIPKQDCVRLLRAKAGLLTGLKTIKG